MSEVVKRMMLNGRAMYKTNRPERGARTVQNVEKKTKATGAALQFLP